MFEHGGLTAPGGEDKQIQVTMGIEIAAPPETVWPYLVDWENLGRWMLEASDFRVTSERREGVGVEAEATIRMFGITSRDRVRITRWEPPAALEVSHLGRVKGTGYLELGPSEIGTALFWRESLTPPLGRLGKIVFRFFRRGFRRTFERDLWVLKDLIEGAG